MSRTYKCTVCKETFRLEELVEYAGLYGTAKHKYCRKCLEKKQDEDYFMSTITKVFGLKKPGSRIWGDRSKIQKEYGYTDRQIADCLLYVYEVEKIPKRSNSLYFVNPTMMGKTIKYKNMLAAKGNSFAQAMANEYIEYIAPIKREEKEEKPSFDFDSYFDD